MLAFLLCIVIFALSWWNAWRAGGYWTEVRITGGWERVLVTLAVCGSALGFTIAYAGFILLVFGFVVVVDSLLIWFWLTLGGLLLTAVATYPIEGMLVVWRRRSFGDPALGNYGQEPYMLAAWRETAQRPGVLRSVSRSVDSALHWRPRLGRWRTASSGGRSPISWRARSSGGTAALSGSRGSGGSTPDAAAMAAMATNGPGMGPTAGKLGGGVKLTSSGGSGSKGGGLDGFDLDLDGDAGAAILVIAAVIIAILAGAMTTVVIVRNADRKVAFDVLAETAWYDWED